MTFVLGVESTAEPAAEAVAEALGAAGAALDAVAGLDVTVLADAELLALVRGGEVLRRRVEAIGLLPVAELDRRGLAGEHGCTSSAAFLSQLLRIDPREAAGRVRATADLAPRRELTGAPLPPLFAVTATACLAGEISAEHAQIVRHTVESICDKVRPDVETWTESFLVEQARQFEPVTLRKLAARVRDSFDPDGTLTEEAERERRRDLTIYQRPDGSAQVRGELTALCAESLLTVLDTLARPKPGEGKPAADEKAARDPRTPGQRRHDGLHGALATLLRCGELPDRGGVSTTLLFTMSADQAATGIGLARTGHGALVPARTALSHSGDARMQTVVLSAVKGIEGYSTIQRLFTEGQRLAMVARDGGCSFPGCTAPPQQCQAHHVVDHALGGPTSVTNGTLLCGYHHHTFEMRGWRCEMRDGRPLWRPPAWIDRTEAPRRNHAHDPPMPDPP